MIPFSGQDLDHIRKRDQIIRLNETRLEEQRPSLFHIQQTKRRRSGAQIHRTSDQIETQRPFGGSQSYGIVTSPALIDGLIIGGGRRSRLRQHGPMLVLPQFPPLRQRFRHGAVTKWCPHLRGQGHHPTGESLNTRPVLVGAMFCNLSLEQSGRRVTCLVRLDVGRTSTHVQ